MHESLQIFGQAESAKAQTGPEEAGADSGVHAHRANHFINVGAQPFRQVGNHVGVGNLQRQKRI